MKEVWEIQNVMAKVKKSIEEIQDNTEEIF